MNLIRLTLSNLKRYLKTPGITLTLILMPSILIFMVTSFSPGSEESIYTPSIAIVCNRDGKYEKELLKELNAQDMVYDFTMENKALDKLKNNDISSVFVLNNSFSSDIDNLIRPSIKEYKTQDGGGSIWAESKIENFITNSLKFNFDPSLNSKIITTKVTENKSLVTGNAMVSVLLISYCMYINASYLGKDLLDLRSSNVLRRMISTKNKDFELIFSIFFALFLIQALTYSFILVFLNLLFNFNFTSSSIMLVVANSFVSTGLIIASARLFKTEIAMTLVSIVYSILSMILSLPLVITSLSEDFAFLNNIAKLTPIYWTLESLNTGNILLPLISLILIGLVFVTAGSFKLRDFAKN
ncbi:MAG: ABC transporter permease [Romboutsia sp.]